MLIDGSGRSSKDGILKTEQRGLAILKHHQVDY